MDLFRRISRHMTQRIQREFVSNETPTSSRQQPVASQPEFYSEGSAITTGTLPLVGELEEERNTGGINDMHLPLEVLLQIFVHLDSIERRRIERVCHWWMAVLRNEPAFQEYIRIDARYFDLRFPDPDRAPAVCPADVPVVFPTLSSASTPLPYLRLPDLMRFVVSKLVTTSVKLVVFTSVNGDCHSLPYALPSQLLYSLFHDARRDLPPFVVAITGGSPLTDWLEVMCHVDSSLRCKERIKARRCWDKSDKVSHPVTECRPTEYWRRDPGNSYNHYAFDNTVRSSVLKQEGLQLNDASCRNQCTCRHGHLCPWQLNLYGLVDWFYDSYNHPRKYDKGPSWINRCERWVVEWKRDRETSVIQWQAGLGREPLFLNHRLLQCTKLRDSPADHQCERRNARS